MEIDRKLIVEQEQIDIDDEMAEDEEGDIDDNSWLGRLGAQKVKKIFFQLSFKYSHVA